MSSLLMRGTGSTLAPSCKMPNAPPTAAAMMHLAHLRSPSATRPVRRSSHTVLAVHETLNPLVDYLQSQADIFATYNLPEPLIHWGHPGNMMVVLLAMGGYGAGYLGWQIRTSDNAEVLAKAKDMHPKLAIGMYIFFALGGLGGITSLLMQNKPIFESAHVTTALAGMSLLTLQAVLPAFFSGSQGARTVHAFLGTGVLGLFFVHAALGLQLGLSI